MASGNANTLTTWEKNWLRTKNKGEKIIKDARTTGNRRLWSATLVRAEWRRVAAPEMMMMMMLIMMMIHSNSRSVSYGVLNFILQPQHHFQASALTFYRCAGIT